MSELFTGETVAAASAAVTPAATPAADPSAAAAGASPAAETTATASAALPDGPGGTPVVDPVAAPPPVAEPPQEKWPTILQNARTKATQETEAKYAWAATIPEVHRSTVQQFYQTLDQDPVLAIETLMVGASRDPIHAPQLRSLLGRLLGTRGGERPGAAPASRALPEPDFEDEQGHQFYSAGRIQELVDAVKGEITATYAKELTPLKTDLQTRAARAAQAEAQHEAEQWAERRYAQVSQWPHYQAHEAAIAAAMTADPDLEVGDAYIQIVVPQLSQQERQTVVADLRTKANASSQNPADAGSPASRPPKDFREALAQLPASAWR